MKARIVRASLADGGAPGRRPSLPGVLCALLAALPLACGGEVETSIGGSWTPPADGPASRAILFVSDRGGNEDIWAIEADGTGERQLTRTEGEGRGSWVPAWSRDGAKVVFASNRDEGGDARIFVMRPDGSAIRHVENGPLGGYVPGWSPDGRWIAFSDEVAGNMDVYLMRADGSDVRRLTYHDEVDCCPDWSPDGSWIAFSAQRQGQGEIRAVRPDGGEDRRIGRGWLPRWSPDGTSIAFMDTSPDAAPEPGKPAPLDVYVMDADGSDVRRLTDYPGIDYLCGWSPDGRRIAFVSDRDVQADEPFRAMEIYVMDADGSDVRRLTFNEDYDGHCAW